MHNKELFAEKINFLIENESARKEMGEKAIKRAQDFEISSIMNKWISLFEQLISKTQK